MPSAAAILSIQTLPISPVCEQRRSFLVEHLRQARHPWMVAPASSTSSVSMPSLASSPSTWPSRMAVFPPLRALPLIATTFIGRSLRNSYSRSRRGGAGVSIGIGGRIAPPPLPHHRTYGSVYGGSIGYAIDLRPMTEVQTRRERHLTRLGPEPGSGSRATGRIGHRRFWPPIPCSRPAGPVPHTACGLSSTVAKKRIVHAF